MARTVHAIDLDALPRDAQGCVEWMSIADAHGADFLIDVASSATHQGHPKLTRSARAAHTRAVLRDNGLTSPRGRPMKGSTRRTARLTLYVEPSVRDAFDSLRASGESRADLLTRWTVERGGAA
jgi:hypothetical protein